MAVCVSGGTGSFGGAMARFLHERGESIRIISRDEAKQEAMQAALPSGPRTTYVIADIRDEAKLVKAFDGCDTVIHAAALKRVPTGERQGDEFVKTNVHGSQSVINAAIACGVKKTFLISSDKAVHPVNLYGKTKSVAESLFTQANTQGASRGCKFGTARGGNVWGSRGSVVEIWRNRKAAGLPLVVTDPDATRFHLPMDQWLEFCWLAINEMHGGEVFIPKCQSWRLGDLAEAFDCEIVQGAIRGGDKTHESLFSDDEASRVVDIGWAYVLEPAPDLREVMRYTPWKGQRAKGAYTSLYAGRIPGDELRRMV